MNCLPCQNNLVFVNVLLLFRYVISCPKQYLWLWMFCFLFRYVRTYIRSIDEVDRTVFIFRVFCFFLSEESSGLILASNLCVLCILFFCSAVVYTSTYS